MHNVAPLSLDRRERERDLGAWTLEPLRVLWTVVMTDLHGGLKAGGGQIWAVDFNFWGFTTVWGILPMRYSCSPTANNDARWTPQPRERAGRAEGPP